ncbi:sulfotransferase [Rheinheimera baltica]|uniref:tetratricopeptide repeat-containing sulfotransferase family protein n=1 Tax=Rheinheimera baltica TaxID=67576 RepID=UPI00273D8BEF|nr:sulfotransferase [Rheinheimera baltica]MDP5141724.1 sulfotransferase [Rheinheimera baltica]
MTFDYQFILDVMRQGKRTEAVALIAHFIEKAPALKADWLKVASLALRIGEITLAKQAADLFYGSCRKDINADIHYAGIYAEAGDLQNALKIIDPYIKENTALPSLQHLAGTVYAQLGQLGKARVSLIYALELAPYLGITWFTLASIVNFKEHPVLLQKLEQAYEQCAGQDLRNKQQFLYALGKAYDDVGYYDKAWQSYSAGASIIRSLSKYSPDTDTTEVEAIINNFTSGAQQLLPYSRSNCERGIAILGLPRSGTTLLGQMLSEHSKIAGAAEFNGIGAACFHLQSDNFLNFPAYIKQHGHAVGALDHIASVYQHVAKQYFPNDGFRVDKTLNLNRYFGIWAQAFPKGKAIYIRRNDENTAWSCFKTNFRSQAAWSWSANSIKSYISNERRLLEHWKTIYNARILEINYEDLVAEPELTLTKVCNHLGLEFEGSMLHFYKSKSPVYTSSVGQVHQPLEQSKIELSERYPQFLFELGLS